MLFRRLCIEKSVVARTMASLEEAGYVERPTCQKDKRVIRLHPTPKALELQPKLQELWATCEQYLIEDMTEDEVAALERLLEQMKLRAAKWMEAEK
jgi:DNA-binding MarR family transcriptional regulator